MSDCGRTHPLLAVVLTFIAVTSVIASFGATAPVVVLTCSIGHLNLSDDGLKNTELAFGSRLFTAALELLIFTGLRKGLGELIRIVIALQNLSPEEHTPQIVIRRVIRVSS